MTLHTSRVRYASVPPVGVTRVVTIPSSSRFISSVPSRSVATSRGPLKARADLSSIEVTPVVYDEHYGCNYRPPTHGTRDSWSAYRISDETLDDADDLVYQSKQRDADVLREVDRQMVSAFEIPRRSLKRFLTPAGFVKACTPMASGRPANVTLTDTYGYDNRNDVELEDMAFQARRPPRPPTLSGSKVKPGRSNLTRPTFGMTEISQPLETLHERKALAFQPREIRLARSVTPASSIGSAPASRKPASMPMTTRKIVGGTQIIGHGPSVRASSVIAPVNSYQDEQTDYCFYPHALNPAVTTSKFYVDESLGSLAGKELMNAQNRMISYEDTSSLRSLPGAAALKNRVQQARELSQKQRLLLDQHVPIEQSRVSNLESVRRAERAGSAPPPQNPHKVSALRSHIKDVLKRTARK